MTHRGELEHRHQWRLRILVLDLGDCTPASLSAMTLPIALEDDHRHHHDILDVDDRPAKRVRFDSDSLLTKDVGTKDGASLVRKHPLRVRPSGNALTSPVNLKSACGLFASVPDELLVLLLEALGARDLLRFGASCRALHAFTRNEELWRALFIE